MPRVNWNGNWSPQINVAKTQHQVTSIEDDFPDFLDAPETVYAPNEFEVTGTPWGVGSHGLHIFLDRQQG